MLDYDYLGDESIFCAKKGSAKENLKQKKHLEGIEVSSESSVRGKN